MSLVINGPHCLTFCYIDLLIAIWYYFHMKTTQTASTVCFSVKGQVVIPRQLRQEFEIDEGTRAQVYAEGDHIVLKPLTAKRYDQLQGCLKGTGVLEALMEDRKRERER